MQTPAEYIAHPAASAGLLAEQVRLSLVIADRESVAAVQEQCPAVQDATESNVKWLDTRVMLDPREHCSEVVDMNFAVLQYARMRQLIHHAPGRPHLVRVASHAKRL